VNNVKTIRPRSLTEAYADARMGDTCPNCAAPPGDWCQRPDGHHRRIPCLKRMHRPNRQPIDRQRLNAITEMTQP
jgi:hypothetical protein